MDTLFASGRIVDLILGLMVLEAVVLIAYRSRGGRGMAPGDLAPMLLAGAFLLLALRLALTAAPWPAIAACLGAAGAAHAWDVARRVRDPDAAVASRKSSASRRDST